jgi:hypothetical protein
MYLMNFTSDLFHHPKLEICGRESMLAFSHKGALARGVAIELAKENMGDDLKKQAQKSAPVYAMHFSVQNFIVAARWTKSSP